jgi:DNA-binding NarL/FixJ family response regulator
MLNLSNRTVDVHRAIMMEKVGAKNTVQLVIYAIKNKLIFIL